MNPQLASVIRFALAALASHLVSKGVLPEVEQDAFTSTALTLVGAGIGVASLFWSARSNSRFGQLLRLALSMPSNSTVAELRETQSVMRYERTPTGAAGLKSLGIPGWQDFVLRQAIASVLALVANSAQAERFRKYLVPLRDALNTIFPV